MTDRTPDAPDFDEEAWAARWTDKQHPLFEFLRLLAVVASRKTAWFGPTPDPKRMKRLSAPQAAVAMLVAFTCDRTSGKDCYVDHREISRELGISERQVYRYFEALKAEDDVGTERGWFQRTHLPRRPDADGQGRRALYRIRRPDFIDLLYTQHLTEAAEEQAGAERLPPVGVEASGDTPRLDPQPLTVPGPAHDVAPPELGALIQDPLPADGHPCISGNDSRASDACMDDEITVQADSTTSKEVPGWAAHS